jgi:hypothetical protein
MKTNFAKRPADLSKEDVLRIWTMRAGGNLNKDIAKDIGCSPWAASDVITHGAGPKVPIPAEIKKAALATVIPKKGRTRKSAIPVSSSLKAIESTLPGFVNACIQFERSHKACLNEGISEETLILFMAAIRKQVDQEKA